MRIRKRSSTAVSSTQSVQPPPAPQPIVFKLQHEVSRLKLSLGPATECSNMQEIRLERVGDQAHDSPQSTSDVYADPPAMESNHRLSDAQVKEDDHSDDDDGDSEDDDVNGRQKLKQQCSPTKRRKIEHESSLLSFEGPSSMTDAELLVVNELANGVRQRLAANSEHSTSEKQAGSARLTKPAENSKDALISSIFYVFDICGEHGLSASEVVKYMLDHRLPGLKEGGARHTVQVANVLRSSSSFISLGDKRYLLCSSLDSRHESKRPTSSRHIKIIAPASPPSGSDSSSDEDELEKRTLNPTTPRRAGSKPPRGNNAHSHSRSGMKKVQAEKPVTPQVVVVEAKPEVARPGDDDEAEPVVVKTTRRRGPSSSQKGKGSTQCKRYDGRGWQCSRLTEPGYSLCVHHQDLINKRAAKLKEQQTLNRLMESQHRKLAKTPPPPPTAPAAVTPKPLTSNNNVAADHHRDAPVQKRKMLSLLAIK